jgi:hypothetical protein
MPRWLDRALPHLTIEPPEEESAADEEEPEELEKAA